ncbi:MAG: HAD family hydrolase [Candidatus Magasanikbacteria bacterium]
MYVLDFDNTLYNTHAMVSEIEKVLASFHVSTNHIQESLELAIRGTTGSDYNYSFELHQQILEDMGYENLQNLTPELEKVFTQSFIFEDTFSFLDELKKQKEKIILLTAGNENFQNKKIDHANIRQYFENVFIIKNGKEKIIQELILQENPVYCINDSLYENIQIKNSVIGVQVITKFNKERYTKEECECSKIPYFNTLTEIIQYVRNQ